MRLWHRSTVKSELLLLAAAQSSSRLAAPLGEDREALEHTVVIGLDPRSVTADVSAEAEGLVHRSSTADGSAEAKVLVHRQLGERPPPLGDVGDPGAGDGLGPARQPLAR